MKKILRLVTTSVLTLTLVACGEASSSVSSSVSSTPASSSVSSPVSTSTFANVSSITLSAGTDVLTQVVGSLKTVVVSAALNANTNPSAALEWLVNGVKSNQTGRVFEFTPTTTGTFKISARSGSIVSNEISVTVGAAGFNITELEVTANNQLEITAPGGATVSVTNNEVLPTSFYDLTKGVYVINLKTALLQGATATVTLARDGAQVISRAFTFDTRAVEVASLVGAGVTDNKDGSFDVKKPHDIASGASGGANTAVETYQVSFEATNLKATSVGFTVTRVSAPSGASAFTNQSGFIGVASDAEETAAGGFQFSLNKDTTPGAYVYRYTLGEKSVDFTVNVVDPVAEVKLDPVTAKATADIYNPANNTEIPVYQNTEFNFKYVYTWTNGGPLATEADKTTSSVTGKTFGVPANADGSFDIVKDYLSVDSHSTPAAIYKTFSFEYVAANFPIPENLVAQTSVAPNQVMVSLAGPDGTSFMRTQSGVQQDTTFLTPATFRADVTTPRVVTQIVDATTVAGKYTYTVKVLQSGVQIYSKDIVVNVKDPVAKLDFTATQLDYSEYVNMFNDLYRTPRTVNFETTLVDASAGADFRGSVLAFDTGVLVANIAKRTAIYKTFSDKSISIFVAPVIANSYSESMHNAEKAKFEKAFLEAYAFPELGTTDLIWGNNIRAFIAKFVPTLAAINSAGTTTAYSATTGVYETTITDYMKVILPSTTDEILADIALLHTAANSGISGGTGTADYVALAPARPTQTNYDDDKAAWETFVKTLYPPYFGNITNVRTAYEPASGEGVYKLTWDNKATYFDISKTISGAAAATAGPGSLVGVYASTADTAEKLLIARNAVKTAFDNFAKALFVTADIDYDDYGLADSVPGSRAAWLKTWLTADSSFPAFNSTAATWEDNVFAFSKLFAATTTTLNGIDNVTDFAEETENSRYHALVNEQVPLLWARLGIPSDVIAALTFSTAAVDFALPALTQGQYNALKIKYDAAILALFPKNSTPDVAKAVEADKVTFKIEKPRAAGLDAKTLAFDVKVSNLQSVASPLAAVGDSFTSKKTTQAKSEFLTFTKSVAGPGEIKNNTALNTANTKLAIELGYNNSTPFVDVATLNLSDTTTKYSYFASTTDTITLNDVFTFDVDFLTVSGIYTINLRVGNLSQQIKVEVVDAKPTVNLGLASGGFVKNATDGKFYKTQATPTESPTVTYTLSLLNIAASATAAYTLEKIDQEGNSTKTTNTIVTTALPGNDGHSESLDLLNLLGPNNTALFQLPEPGNYVINLTVGGVTSSIELVLLDYPTLKVATAKVGTTTLASHDGVFIYDGGAGTADVKFDFTAEAVSLGTTQVYYKITRVVLSTANISGGSISQTNTLAQNVTAAGVTALTFKDKLASISYTLPNAQITDLTGKAVVDFDAANAVVDSAALDLSMIVVQLYVYDNTTTPSAPIFKFIGHKAIFVANADLLA
jgi:hypothetical protein